MSPVALLVIIALRIGVALFCLYRALVAMDLGQWDEGTFWLVALLVSDLTTARPTPRKEGRA